MGEPGAIWDRACRNGILGFSQCFGGKCPSLAKPWYYFAARTVFCVRLGCGGSSLFRVSPGSGWASWARAGAPACHHTLPSPCEFTVLPLPVGRAETAQQPRGGSASAAAVGVTQGCRGGSVCSANAARDRSPRAEWTCCSCLAFAERA